MIFSTKGKSYFYILDSCGGQVPNSGAVITSPGFPSSYNNDVHCTWIVDLEEGHQASVWQFVFDFDFYDLGRLPSFVLYCI